MASTTGARTAPLIPTGTWTVDAGHSSVRFSVKHMGIANVRGKFSEFEGTLEMKESLADCRAFGTVKVASVDTGEPARDDHLRSADFFNVEEFPEMTFESTHVEAIDDESSRVVGNLTMIVGKLLRSDYDMKFNQALGSGNMLVGDKVGLALDVSAVLQAES